MSETPSPDHLESFDPQDNEVEAQHAALLDAVNTARAWLEQTTVEGGASDEEVMRAKIRKQEAAHRLVDFEIAHGMITPPTEEPERYLPEDLGLDSEDQDDLQLYIDSGGVRAIGELLIDRRKLDQARLAGALPDEEYDEYVQDVDDRIADLRMRYEIGQEP